MVLEGAWKIGSVQLDGCAWAPPPSVVCSGPFKVVIKATKSRATKSHYPSTVHHCRIDIRQRIIRIPLSTYHFAKFA